MTAAHTAEADGATGAPLGTVLVLTAMYPTLDRPANGTFVRTQVRSLRERGLQVEVLLVRSRRRGPRTLAGVVKYLVAWRELRQRVRRGDVDVIHAHFVFPALVARCQRRVPVVITFHGDDVLGTVAPAADGGLTWTSRRLVVPLSRALARRAVTIVQSRQMQDRLGRVEAHVVPCEVDLDLFHPTPQATARRALGMEPERVYVLFAADPSIPVKGYALATDVVQRAVALGERVEILVVHREPQARLALFMSACNALLVTSFQEGSPNVVKQAMACNLPVVSADVGDVRELLAGAQPSEVCPRETEALATALVRAAGAGRSDGRQWISWLDGRWVVDRLVECYAEALGKPLRGVHIAVTSRALWPPGDASRPGR